MSQTIKYLVFQGGGVLGTAYTGALKVLEEKNILENIERTAGTSAGAIVSTLVSLRFSASEIQSIIKSMDFSSFKDKWNPFRVLSRYGLYKGDVFLNWLKDQIAKKGLARNATFADFNTAGCRDLTVFAADLNIKGLKTFSYATTPNVIVAEAVRASMSIPILFSSWQFTNNVPDNHIYVDGGIIYNFPITIFDLPSGPNNETLGFHLDNINGTRVVCDLKKNELFEYTLNLFETILNAQTVDFSHDTGDLRRTIRIDSLGISATNFSITEAEKLHLIASGERHTRAFFENNQLIANS